MKTKITLKSIILLWALIVGSVSEAWAEKTYTYALSSGANGFYTDSNLNTHPSSGSSNSITSFYASDGKQFTCSGANVYFSSTSSGYLFLTKGAILTLPTYSGEKITKVSLSNSSGCSTSVQVSIKSGSNTASSSQTWSTTSSTYNYNIGSSYQSSTLGIAVANKNAQITQIVITTESTAGTTATPSISGDTPFVGSTKVTITNASSANGADIYYTLNGDDPTTTTSATCFAYSAPFSIDATTIVKAIAKKSTDTNASSVVSKSFTKVTTKTVTEALTAIAALEDNGTIDDQCVSGVVCTAGSLSSGAITYYISDDGTETNRLQVFKGKGLYNAEFENSSDIAVGDAVVVFGQLKKYVSGNNTTPEFNSGNYLISKVSTPTLSADPATAQAFTYVAGNGPSEDQMFTIAGKNLVSADITATVSSDYEITDNTDYSGSVTIASGDIVSVRLKAGLAKGTHNGTLTLSSTDATNVVINLSGTVTGQTFAIEQYTTPATAHGTITFLPASPIEEGTEVTLSAEPAAGYDFTTDSWVIYKQSGNDFVVDNSITVTANKFTMPAYAIWVDGTFTAKPTYDVTCVADPVAGGTIEAQPASAYEGQEVTLSYLAETGYELKSIVITKTSDGSATGIIPAKSGDDYTFTMPAYAVTATAKFLSETYEGTFAIYSGNLTEGDYILVYDGVAMNNSLSNNKLGATSVKDDISDNLISNPSRSIVWHIAQSSTSGYWTIYNAKDGKYVCGTEGNTNVSLVDSPVNNEEVNEGAIWSVSGTYDFKCKANEEQSTVRYLRTYGTNSAFGNYASSNGGPLTLYKFTVLTDRTITFDGNGGTYNDATTYTQNVYDGVQAKLDANKFTKTDYEFAGWNTNANGENGTAYADGANITVTGSDLTLYAQWAPLYTLTVDANIVGGSVAVEGDVTSAIEGTEITLTSTPTAGHKFSAWNVYKAGDESTKVTVSDENKFSMPAYNVVISATFAETQTYSLIADVDDIVSGKHYIIASGANGDIKAMGAQGNNIRSVVSVKASNGVIPETDGVYEFVIYGPNADGYYSIYDAKYDNNNGGYLYASSGTYNYMGTQASNDANGKWSIEIANSGAATINAHGINTRNRMRFNSDRFSCYLPSTSVSALPYLYVKDGDTPVATTASVKLNAYGYATFASASVLDFLDADKAEYSAWQITGVTNSKITFGQIKSTVAAGKGVLLKGTPNATINLNILPVGGDALSTNKLVGITAAKAVEANQYYGLSGNQFKKVGAGTVPAGKALLPASVVGNASRLTFVFEGETTGVQELKNSRIEGTESCYDLQGRRVMKPTKGLYIVNGKKVVIK